MLLEHAVDAVAFLHTAGASLHTADVAGNTALHIAAAAASLAAAATAGSSSSRSRGANSHMTSPAGAVVRYLLENGADVGVTNRAGQTPLHVAAGNGALDAVRVLVQYGAPLFQTDLAGQQAVDIAMRYGHADVVAVLQSLMARQQSGEVVTTLAPGGSAVSGSESSSTSGVLGGGGGGGGGGLDTSSYVEKRILSATRAVINGNASLHLDTSSFVGSNSSGHLLNSSGLKDGSSSSARSRLIVAPLEVRTGAVTLTSAPLLDHPAAGHKTTASPALHGTGPAAVGGGGAQFAGSEPSPVSSSVVTPVGEGDSSWQQQHLSQQQQHQQQQQQQPNDVNPSLTRSDVDGLLMQLKALMQQNHELDTALVEARSDAATLRAAQELNAATLAQRTDVRAPTRRRTIWETVLASCARAVNSGC